MKLSYEANVLNGMQALDAEGNPTPFSRLLGQSSASEPGLIAFQATNGHGRAKIQSEIITNYLSAWLLNVPGVLIVAPFAIRHSCRY
jgi:hypothetical protein